MVGLAEQFWLSIKVAEHAEPEIPKILGRYLKRPLSKSAKVAGDFRATAMSPRMLKIAMLYLVFTAISVLWWWLLNMADPFWAWSFLFFVVITGLLAVELLQTEVWRNTNEKVIKFVRTRHP
jgi:hypothetical protein